MIIPVPVGGGVGLPQWTGPLPPAVAERLPCLKGLLLLTLLLSVSRALAGDSLLGALGELTPVLCGVLLMKEDPLLAPCAACCDACSNGGLSCLVPLLMVSGINGFFGLLRAFEAVMAYKDGFGCLSDHPGIQVATPKSEQAPPIRFLLGNSSLGGVDPEQAGILTSTAAPAGTLGGLLPALGVEFHGATVCTVLAVLCGVILLQALVQLAICHSSASMLKALQNHMVEPSGGFYDQPGLPPGGFAGAGGYPGGTGGFEGFSGTGYHLGGQGGHDIEQMNDLALQQAIALSQQDAARPQQQQQQPEQRQQ